MQKIKLSIIMPLYNVEKTVRLALESILMQNFNFAYEIIVVNDASTDGTLDVLKDYANKYPQIKIIDHTENQGNAIAFYNALCVANGDYFCVLDGDDYYTVRNKLQKQVDFLDNDKQCKYVAVTHKYVRVNQNYEILDDRQLFNGELDWSYADFLRGLFYSHTATYMYRNLFRGCVPEKFKEPLYRGDNPRTFMHLLYSKGRVKQLNFVGSVYFFDGNGIWSQTSPTAQHKRNIQMLEELGTNLSSELESQLLNKVIEYRKLINKSVKPNQSEWFASEYFFNKLYSYANIYAFKHQDFIFQQVYKSEFLDSFCETLGFVEMVKHGYTPHNTVVQNPNNIMIAVSNLTTTGGGVYHEIKDIINMYADYNVYLLWTDVDGPDKLDNKVKQQLESFKNLTCIYGQAKTTNKLSNLCDKIIQIAPAKIYHYCGHNNVFLSALIQSMLSKNICIFSFDHGFSLGLDNTNYNTYIAKRPMDYEILANEYGAKVIFMPCWNPDKIGCNRYKPFNGHSALVTACAAARYYKLSSGNYGYIYNVIRLLKRTGGKHIHYGPIPDTELKSIYTQLAANGLPQDCFINIPWAENLSESMYNECVDVFIEPFPTVSYKITLDVLSAGIPVITHKSYMRMGITDFIYPNHMEWSNVDEFIDILSNVTSSQLSEYSKLSREYYEQNHMPSVLSKYFTTETSFKTPEKIPFYDSKLIDISQISNLLNVEIGKEHLQFVDNKTIAIERIYETKPKTKVGKFLRHLGFKQRYKEMFYGLCLIVAQIPIVDLLIRSEKRQKLLKRILKYYR